MKYIHQLSDIYYFLCINTVANYVGGTGNLAT
jgi:hypothetical protein